MTTLINIAKNIINIVKLIAHPRIKFQKKKYFENAAHCTDKNK